MNAPTPELRIKRICRYLKRRRKHYEESGELRDVISTMIDSNGDNSIKLNHSDVEFLLAMHLSNATTIAGQIEQIEGLKAAREDARQEAHNERALKLQAREAATASEKELAFYKDTVREAFQARYGSSRPDTTDQGKLVTLLREPPPILRPSNGTTEINRARTYQLTHHPDPFPATQNSETRATRQRELLLAALSLLLRTPELYPFGAASYSGVVRTERNRLAHAGACIAAIIDLWPSERPEHFRKREQMYPMPADEDVYPGTFGDYANE